MYRYNDNGRLVTSWVPINIGTLVNLTDEEAEKCVGFNQDGSPIFDDGIPIKKEEIRKAGLANVIKGKFEADAKTVGVMAAGLFYRLEDSSVIIDPFFQYDKDSWQLLESVVNETAVNYWRSVDNKNISLSNEQKANLLGLLKLTYFTKFAESRREIDAL